MNYLTLLGKIGRALVELITIGLIGLLVFVFLIGMWESKYLSRYKYVQGQDIKEEILKSKLDSALERKNEWHKVIKKGGTGVIDSAIIGALKLFGAGKGEPKSQFTYVNLEIRTDTLLKLQDKAGENNRDIELYINKVLGDHVKQ